MHAHTPQRALHGGMLPSPCPAPWRRPAKQITRLIGSTLDSLYSHGEIISIYALVGDLHKALGPKDTSTTEVSRPG
jgi:hypothetical protein